MGAFEKFPYTNFHDLNLDWFLNEFKKLQDEWNNFGYTVTATAVVGTVPSVEVTGDLENGLNFQFTLVKGETGEEGPQGETGNGISAISIDSNYQITFTFTDGTSFTTPSLKGPQGEGLEVLDVYATLSDLQAAHPSGNSGDMYLVGVSPSYVLYVWSTSQATWVQAGALSSPSPSVTTPLMDGVADNGLEFAYARGDHRHPSDTTKADLTYVQNVEAAKQDVLVSGTNIKTINSNSILGSGDISTLRLSDVYPVGSIYMSVNSTDPGMLFGFGTWDQIKDKFLLAAGDVYAGGSSGGEATHKLTANELPKMSGSASFRSNVNPGTFSPSGVFSETTSSSAAAAGTSGSGAERVLNINFGNDEAHNNMPPYLTVYMWIRTA